MTRIPTLWRLALAALFLAAGDSVSAEAGAQQKPIVQAAGHGNYTCNHPPYKAHILSRSPLVIYLADFITAEERLHLQEIADPLFSHSAVVSSDTETKKAIHSVRTSQSTSVPRDAVVRCIEARALAFQGFDIPRNHLEPIQLVKYAPGQRYHFHTDWFTDAAAHATAALGGNRASSFFAYVAVSADITGGGTNFPLLDPPADPRWCAFLDCDDEYAAGVTFRPVAGNAVYWENLLPGGAGDERVLHAGLPVTSGGKIGMNIWTRQGALPDEMFGGKD